MNDFHEECGWCPECDPFGDSFVCACGVHRPPPTHYHRDDLCPTPFGNTCCCPRPLEDFENGYANELGTCWSGLDWRERANANPLNATLFLRCKYGQPFTATAENGVKTVIKRSKTIEEIAMQDRPLLSMIKRKQSTDSYELKLPADFVFFDGGWGYQPRPGERFVGSMGDGSSSPKVQPGANGTGPLSSQKMSSSQLQDPTRTQESQTTQDYGDDDQ